MVLMWSGVAIGWIWRRLCRSLPKKWDLAALLQLAGVGVLAYFLMLIPAVILPHSRSVVVLGRAAFWTGATLLAGGTMGLLVRVVTVTKTGRWIRPMNRCMAWGVWVVALALGYYLLTA